MTIDLRVSHLRLSKRGVLNRFACILALTMSVTLGLVSVPAVAADDSQLHEDTARLIAALNKAIPDLPVIDVHSTPIADLYAVELEGGQLLYTTAGGDYFIAGDMYKVGDRVVNLAEERRAQARLSAMEAVPLEDMVVFSPAGQTRTYVSVFTDVDCTYCRIADYNALGIEVRYLAYPRAGLGTPTANKIVSAWCADNRNEALTALKAGLTIPAANCDNPIAAQFELGRKVGVNGTPAIVTADGRLLPGYMPAAQLAEALDL